MSMKFPKNPTPSPNVNPSIKNDRGRIILILVVAAIAYYVVSSWGGFQTFWDDLMYEIEGELGIDLDGKDNTSNPLYDEEYVPEIEYEPNYEYEPEPEPAPAIEVTTETSTFLDSNVADDEARRILQESRQEIIEQLRAQGQEDQIPMVLDMLDHMEADL